MEDIKHAAVFLIAADLLAMMACFILSINTGDHSFYLNWWFVNGCFVAVAAACAVILGLISGGLGIYKLVKRD